MCSFIPGAAPLRSRPDTSRNGDTRNSSVVDAGSPSTRQRYVLCGYGSPDDPGERRDRSITDRCEGRKKARGILNVNPCRRARHISTD